MLKRLELIGFKSFADKTRFDFAPGITGVVGPNGSGKSNVVDAVRWVLGEQSAKTLRGGGMADVIFNGSSSRKSLGMAEVTIVFDNVRRLLAVDSDEVQITRRVYRDGTGEYLINGQMSRLKDIKDAFLGTGAGAGGYTIIAQGRVDELLQASAADRREIFDEAAGISRFKAKKAEALRKLAVVEHNLTRSKDRLDSLEAQLRTLRMQAAKAQKQREYTDRVRELRVGLGQREYHELSIALRIEESALDELKAEVSAAGSRAAELERIVHENEHTHNATADALRRREAQLAEARMRIAGLQSTLKHERSLASGQETDLAKCRKQRAELVYRIASIEANVAALGGDEEAVETGARSARQRADTATADLAKANAELVALDRRSRADRELQFELVARAATARSTEAANLGQVERMRNELSRKQAEIDHTSARAKALDEALDGLSRADSDLRAQLAAARGRLSEHVALRDELRLALAQCQKTSADLRIRQSDLGGRAEVLETLERTLEGLGAGVREMLGLVSSPNSSPHDLSAIAGLVADLLSVPRDVAGLVELALGDSAQRFVVTDPEAIDAIAVAAGDVPGRVGFIPLTRTMHAVNLSSEPRSLASLVECPSLPDLPDRLLGTVGLAETLTDARLFARGHPGWRFVTRAGELLETDGTLSVGPMHAGAGIVSRKSELRDLRRELQRLAAEIITLDAHLTELRHTGDTVDGAVGAAETEVELLSGEAGGLQQEIARQRQLAEQLAETVDLLRSEIRVLAEDVRRGEERLIAARKEAEEAEAAAAELRNAEIRVREAIAASELHRDRCQIDHTDAQVALSRAEAERDRLRERHLQMENDLRKRRAEMLEIGAAADSLSNRVASGVMTMLRTSSALADSYRDKEIHERHVATLAAESQAHRHAHTASRDELAAIRAGWGESQTIAHARELTARDLRGQSEAVTARLREEYGIDLATDPPEEVHLFEMNQAAAREEIEELRKKLARLGGVNMEALEELVRVEAEFDGLRSQHADLASARASLQEVIDTINGDSRKIFADTLAAVQGYFQELFRKLFGGGQADIVLESGVDVLEAGIDITARPPGKELRALSLLSGGEKTLTAVALLLAIFRNKPSPFCLLDEVDAALDEANTHRLAVVLRDFLEHSQFVVITHKKRTMAAVDRLWGVTMQEAGVSRLLPMRFEDWTEPSDKAAA